MNKIISSWQKLLDIPYWGKSFRDRWREATKDCSLQELHEQYDEVFSMKISASNAILERLKDYGADIIPGMGCMEPDVKLNRFWYILDGRIDYSLDENFSKDMQDWFGENVDTTKPIQYLSNGMVIVFEEGDGFIVLDKKKRVQPPILQPNGKLVFLGKD